MRVCLRALVLNRPAVLARVAGQVARRGVNIEHFTARNIEEQRTAITIGIDADERTAEGLAKGLARLIDVLDVTWSGADAQACAARPGLCFRDVDGEGG